MTNLRYHNMARTKPSYIAYAGDGFVQQGVGVVVSPPPTAQMVTLPGYSHVDTIGAARVQNDGKPDTSAQTLADFVKTLG